MKVLWSIPLLASCLFSQESEPPPGANVNSRYTVESVELSRPLAKRVSRSLRRDLDELVGLHFDQLSVDKMAARIRREIHVVVKPRIEKGLKPEHVRVIYEARERRWDEDDAKVTKLAYHSKQGTTAGVQLGFDAGPNRFNFGVETDADTLLERYSGYNLGFSHRFSNRVRVRFEFESLHQQWNQAVQSELLNRPDVPGIYRERYRLDPAIVILLTPGLSLTTGLSFQHFQTQFPAARYEAANAVITTLRHRRRWQVSDSSAGHQWDAGYSLRAATSLLDSDYVYTRHEFDARYAMQHGHHALAVRALGGLVSERAPLYERFTLGDTRTLRGWNKFDVAPAGGTRSAYGSVQYTYRKVGGFYDTGSVWDRRAPARARHAAGILLAWHAEGEGPFLAIGFPLRSGGVAPLLILGMNF